MIKHPAPYYTLERTRRPDHCVIVGALTWGSPTTSSPPTPRRGTTATWSTRPSYPGRYSSWSKSATKTTPFLQLIVVVVVEVVLLEGGGHEGHRHEESSSKTKTGSPRPSVIEAMWRRRPDSTAQQYNTKPRKNRSVLFFVPSMLCNTTLTKRQHLWFFHSQLQNNAGRYLCFTIKLNPIIEF